MEIDLARLAEPFPADAISWRAQTMNREGTSALALAYLTARDVMDRLDDVCGPANWQDRYEVHGDKTICYLSIRIGDEWIVKADGGGDSDVEGEKGALSGALKRAAVKWGIGRYLYDLGNTWVGCESSERQGKKFWKRWTEDPWSKVRNRAQFLPAGNAPSRLQQEPEQPREQQNDTTPGGRKRKPGPRLTDMDEANTIRDVLIENAMKQTDPDKLGEWWKKQAGPIASLPDAQYDRFAAIVETHKADLLADRVAS